MVVNALIFAKYPEPGQVNTRLVPPLSPHQAAQLHRAALGATCELAHTIAGAKITLVVTPDEMAETLAGKLVALVHGAWAQGAGSLGDRLARAAQRAFGDGAQAVLLLGADSPTIPAEFLTKAVAALAHHDAVMGPADDGGYYLLGLRTHRPELFDNVDWGSGQVAEQTRCRARSAGIRLHELDPWHDIDRPEDIRRAASSLHGEREHSPLRRALVQELDRLLPYLDPSESNHG